MAAEKNQNFAAALAAFVAGAGLGAGTTVIVQPSTPEQSGWKCTVMVNDQVLCSPIDSIFVEDSIIVNTDAPDAGIRSTDNTDAPVAE